MAPGQVRRDFALFAIDTDATLTSGDVDVLSASVTENKDVWYENLQRQE